MKTYDKATLERIANTRAREVASEALALVENYDDVDAHNFLCHNDGSGCDDGCDAMANPARLDALNDAWKRWEQR